MTLPTLPIIMETARTTALHDTELESTCSGLARSNLRDVDEITEEKEDELLYGPGDDGEEEDASSDELHLRVSDEDEADAEDSGANGAQLAHRSNSQSSATGVDSELVVASLSEQKPTLDQHCDFPLDKDASGAESIDKAESGKVSPDDSTMNQHSYFEEEWDREFDRQGGGQRGGYISYNSPPVHSHEGQWRSSSSQYNRGYHNKRAQFKRPNNYHSDGSYHQAGAYTTNDYQNRYYNKNHNYGRGRDGGKFGDKYVRDGQQPERWETRHGSRGHFSGSERSDRANSTPSSQNPAWKNSPPIDNLRQHSKRGRSAGYGSFGMSEKNSDLIDGEKNSGERVEDSERDEGVEKESRDAEVQKENVVEAVEGEDEEQVEMESEVTAEHEDFEAVKEKITDEIDEEAESTPVVNSEPLNVDEEKVVSVCMNSVVVSESEVVDDLVQEDSNDKVIVVTTNPDEPTEKIADSPSVQEKDSTVSGESLPCSEDDIDVASVSENMHVDQESEKLETVETLCDEIFEKCSEETPEEQQEKILSKDEGEVENPLRNLEEAETPPTNLEEAETPPTNMDETEILPTNLEDSSLPVERTPEENQENIPNETQGDDSTRDCENKIVEECNEVVKEPTDKIDCDPDENEEVVMNIVQNLEGCTQEKMVIAEDVSRTEDDGMKENKEEPEQLKPDENLLSNHQEDSGEEKEVLEASPEETVENIEKQPTENCLENTVETMETKTDDPAPSIEAHDDDHHLPAEVDEQSTNDDDKSAKEEKSLSTSGESSVESITLKDVELALENSEANDLCEQEESSESVDSRLSTAISSSTTTSDSVTNKAVTKKRRSIQSDDSDTIRDSSDRPMKLQKQDNDSSSIQGNSEKVDSTERLFDVMLEKKMNDAESEEQARGVAENGSPNKSVLLADATRLPVSGATSKATSKKVVDGRDTGKVVERTKRKKKRANWGRDTVTEVMAAQVPEVTRQRRKTAKNAEEIIRNKFANNDSDLESSDGSDKFVPVRPSYKQTCSFRTLSPPVLKRSFPDPAPEPNNTVVKKVKTSSEMEKTVETEKPVLLSNREPIKSLNYVRKFFRRDAKDKLAKLKQEELEELLIQKLVETITMRGEIGRLREQVRISERNQEATRTRCQQLAKQIKDFEMVLNRNAADRRVNNDKPVPPIKINRSVGLQVNFMTDQGMQSLRQLQPSAVSKSTTIMNGVNSSLLDSTNSTPVPRRGIKIRSPRRPEAPPSQSATAIASAGTQLHAQVQQPVIQQQLQVQRAPLQPPQLKPQLPVPQQPQLQVQQQQQLQQQLHQQLQAQQQLQVQQQQQLQVQQQQQLQVQQQQQIQVQQQQQIQVQQQQQLQVQPQQQQTLLQQQLQQPQLPTVTPAALVVTKAVDSTHSMNLPSVTSSLQQVSPKGNTSQPTVMQTVVLNGKIPTQQNRQVTVLNAQKSGSNDLIDLTDDEDKTKSLANTTTTVTSTTIPSMLLASKPPQRIQRVTNVLTSQPASIRVVQPSSQPTPTALVNNMNAPKLAYVMQSGPGQGRQVLFASNINQIRPVTSTTRTQFPTLAYKTAGISTLANGTVRVLTTTATGASLQLCKHPAALPDPPTYQTQLTWKLPPPAPSLKISKVTHGIVLSWNMVLSDKYAEIASYQLYAYQEVNGVPPSTNLWKKVGDVRALPLPMACTLTQFSEGNNYHFAVRAVDKHSRLGQYSTPGNISL